MEKTNCAIVVATYNRIELFRRVLDCIKRADYTENSNIELIISIDRASNCYEMKRIADEFEWGHGNKIVILHDERLGLRKHFIFCGGLSKKYGPVIFLEDDVVVNKNFYNTAQQMNEKYQSDERVVGASLYKMSFNETAQRPFSPLEDGSDVFFCSLMSWAPVYFPNQWINFEEWLLKRDEREIICENIPQDVVKWPKSSFKKLHIQYMQQKKLYFAYTRHSCATNFSEPGEHYKKDTNKLQVSMDIAPRGKLKLVSLDESLAVYDAFLEFVPSFLKKVISKDMQNFDFDVDLYGKKERRNLANPFVLTTRKASSSTMSFGRKMVPQEANIINGVQGNEIVLAKVEDVKFGSKGLKKYIDDVLYDIKGSTVLKVIISDVMWSRAFIKSRF